MRPPRPQANTPEADAHDLPPCADLSTRPESPFCCVRCNGPALSESGSNLLCNSCGFSFPIIFGVPLLVSSFDVSEVACRLTEETARKVCGTLGIEANPTVLARLRSILSKNYHIGDLAQVAENNYFLNRLMVGESEKRPRDKDRCGEAPINQEVRYSIDLHYIAEKLPQSRQVTYNVRLTNRGKSTISSLHDNPIYLSYQFVDSRGDAIQGRRTKLPIELLPGRSLTMPIVIDTPQTVGSYDLVIQLVHEYVAWLSEGASLHSVEVCTTLPSAPWDSWHVTGINHGSYDADHEAGRKMLAERLQLQAKPRVLEIGACCNPMMCGLCEDLHCIDIDMQTLQVGHLIAEQKNLPVRYVCADGGKLPYREQSFDWIIMFSTLHHFADPGQVLGNLKRYLKPQGRIAVMCEPLGHYIDGDIYEAFIDELEQGINEQTFSLEEYCSIIERAQLSVDLAVVDVGSVKLILEA